MMELAGSEGILVSGGALTGKDVEFLDLKTKRYVVKLVGWQSVHIVEKI